MNLILASASPRRKDLLESLGIPFEIRTLPVQEKTDGPWFQIALDNAFLKADAVARMHPDSVVIGADTVIRFGDETIGKPADLDDARAILAKLSGRTHDVVTGVCVRCLENDILVRFEEATHVTFRMLTPEAIEKYIKAVNVLDKAGAYAIQEHGDDIIQGIDGSLTNVIGLPVERLTETIRHLLKLS